MFPVTHSALRGPADREEPPRAQTSEGLKYCQLRELTCLLPSPLVTSIHRSTTIARDVVRLEEIERLDVYVHAS